MFFGFYTWLDLAAVLPAAVIASAMLLAEAFFAALALGKLFDRFDVSR